MWTKFRVKNMSIYAKVYQQANGLNQSNVVKMDVFKNGNFIFRYDRGHVSNNGLSKQNILDLCHIAQIEADKNRFFEAVKSTFNLTYKLISKITKKALTV